VLVAGMGAGGNAMLPAQAQRGAHRGLVPGVPTAGDVGGADQGNDPGVVAAALAQVAVEVDRAGHRHVSSASRRRASRALAAAASRRACEAVQGRKRSVAPGAAWASRCRSALATWPSRRYPPMVCASAIN